MFKNLVKRKLTIPLLIALLTIGFFYYLFYPQTKIFINPDFGQSDILHLNLPLKYKLSQSLKNNNISFIAQEWGNGFPVFNQGEIGTFNIFNLILFKLLSPILAFNLNIIISFFLTAFFSYKYALEIKLRKISALFFALSFTFSFYLINQVSHFTIIQAIAFFPLMLYLTHLFIKVKKKKYLVFLSLTLNQQIFSGSPQITFISLLFLLFYFSFHFFNKKKFKKNIVKYLVVFCLFITLGFGLSAIQLFPAKNFLSISNRKAGFDQKTATSFSFPIKHLRTLISPFALGNPAKGTYPAFWETNGSIFWENIAYFGIIGFILALTSLLFLKKNKYIKLFWLTSLISLFLMTGKFSPFYFIFAIFPFNLFRVPSRFIIIFIFSLTALSGLTLDELIKKFKKPIVFVLSYILLFINFLNLFYLSYNYLPRVKTEAFLQKPEIVNFLSPEKKIFTFNSKTQWNDLFLKKGWNSNTTDYLIFKNSLQANMNIFWDVPSFNVYPILVSQRYQLINDLIQAQFFQNDESNNWQVSNFGLKLLKQNGIGFIISSEQLNESAELKLKKYIQDNNQSFFLYEINSPLDYAKLINKIQKTTTIRDFILKINNSGWDLENTIATTANLETLPNLNQADNQINAIEKKANKIKLKVNLSQKAYLLLQQSYLPGWKCYINEKQTKIYPANLNSMVIKLEPGKYNIELSYIPKGFLTGLVISTFCFISLLVLLKTHFLSQNKN
jgi:hypothetical protein